MKTQILLDVNTLLDAFQGSLCESRACRRMFDRKHCGSPLCRNGRMSNGIKPFTSPEEILAVDPMYNTAVVVLQDVVRAVLAGEAVLVRAELQEKLLVRRLMDVAGLHRDEVHGVMKTLSLLNARSQGTVVTIAQAEAGADAFVDALPGTLRDLLFAEEIGPRAVRADGTKVAGKTRINDEDACLIAAALAAGGAEIVTSDQGLQQATLVLSVRHQGLYALTPAEFAVPAQRGQRKAKHDHVYANRHLALAM